MSYYYTWTREHTRFFFTIFIPVTILIIILALTVGLLQGAFYHDEHKRQVEAQRQRMKELDGSLMVQFDWAFRDIGVSMVLGASLNSCVPANLKTQEKLCEGNKSMVNATLRGYYQVHKRTVWANFSYVPPEETEPSGPPILAVRGVPDNESDWIPDMNTTVQIYTRDLLQVNHSEIQNALKGVDLMQRMAYSGFSYKQNTEALWNDSYLLQWPKMEGEYRWCENFQTENKELYDLLRTKYRALSETPRSFDLNGDPAQSIAYYDFVFGNEFSEKLGMFASRIVSIRDFSEYDKNRHAMVIGVVLIALVVWLFDMLVSVMLSFARVHSRRNRALLEKMRSLGSSRQVDETFDVAELISLVKDDPAPAYPRDYHNVGEVLKDPLARAFFTKFTEGSDFKDVLETYARGSRLIMNKKRIFALYMKPGCDLEINISHEMQRDIASFEEEAGLAEQLRQIEEYLGDQFEVFKESQLFSYLQKAYERQTVQNG